MELAGFEGLGGSFVRRAGAVVTGGLPVVDGLDVELAFFHFTDVADAHVADGAGVFSVGFEGGPELREGLAGEDAVLSRELLHAIGVHAQLDLVRVGDGFAGLFEAQVLDALADGLGEVDFVGDTAEDVVGTVFAGAARSWLK